MFQEWFLGKNHRYEKKTGCKNVNCATSISVGMFYGFFFAVGGLPQLLVMPRTVLFSLLSARVVITPNEYME